MDAKESYSSIDLIGKAVEQEAGKLKLDVYAMSSFHDLVVLVKEQIKQTLQQENIPEDSKVIVVKQFLEIIRDEAGMRLQIK